MNEIGIVLDESGSMGFLRDTTIKNLYEFINEHKNEDTRFTITKFSEIINFVCEGVKGEEVDIKYNPRGSTALFDAIGTTFNSLGARFSAMKEEDKPKKVIIAIITDGEENSSREFTLENIKEKIKHQREKYNWEVLFLGANMDAEEYGKSLGIQFNATYTANAKGTDSVYRSVSKAVSDFTTMGFVEEDWNKEVE